MKRYPIWALTLALVWTLGCGDDDGNPPPPPGSMMQDATVAPDGSAGDAMAMGDASTMPPMGDATMPPPSDSGVVRPGDAGVTPMAMDVCDRLCPALTMCVPVTPEECTRDCGGLVGTCAETELDAIRACVDRMPACGMLPMCLRGVDCLTAFFMGFPGM